VEYQRHDPDTSIPIFFRKLMLLIRDVETPYSYWLPEDDFVVLSTLQEASREMDSTGASAWMGSILDFDIVSLRSSVLGTVYFDRSGLESNGRYSRRTAVLSTSVEERLQSSSKIFVAEALLQTRVLRGAIEACVLGGATSQRHLLQLLKFQCLLLGNVESSSKLLLLRQNNPGSSAGQALLGGGNDSVRQLFSDEYAKTLQRCIQNLTPPEEVCAWQEQTAWQFAAKLSASATKSLDLEATPLTTRLKHQLDRKSRIFLEFIGLSGAYWRGENARGSGALRRMETIGLHLNAKAQEDVTNIVRAASGIH